ncbi:helix-turn-helix domain-containing protein [Amycolatopsis saalfeldensis]|uniref:Helix-turn-helix domain-containing protein n=1 Tax=Amycolatopsis saalfeldensis TaxID=394193 RepID=A0A1H8QT19_9PSEU|nr:helix-turn-helix domain-containing protein [Amycolatopsis saalfeldensis]SEO56994.1 Helix-turn-helix domain-containing protein [Amycolatopsis saalfeldensis]
MSRNPRVRLVSVEGLWTPDELSVYLDIPEKTLRDWRLKNYGPPWHRLGKHVRYDPAAVRTWLDGPETMPAA